MTLTTCLLGCNENVEKSSKGEAKHEHTENEVKSVLLYHQIEAFSKDSIVAVLDDINSVIDQIDPNSKGYSLWQVQSDTISDFTLLIQGHWANQQSYDVIHADSSFRRVLDKHLPVLKHTRNWDFYHRYERYKVSK